MYVANRNSLNFHRQLILLNNQNTENRCQIVMKYSKLKK